MLGVFRLAMLRRLFACRQNELNQYSAPMRATAMIWTAAGGGRRLMDCKHSSASCASGSARR